jgi:hypothetical protein
MPEIIREVKEMRVPRRQRDAARRGQALVDGQGVINETVLLCRAAARLAAQDRATRSWRGPGGDHPRPIRQRWGAFLLQTGRGRLTVAQARSLRRRSTRDELLALDAFERQLLGSAL